MTEGEIHIYMGEGKGKTTAAVGLALRFAGSGGQVLFTQFLKNPDSGEIKVLQDTAGITFLPGPPISGFTWNMTESELGALCRSYRDYLQAIRRQAGHAGLLVMDEALAALQTGLIQEKILLDLLDDLKKDTEIVLTGRRPSPALLERADYITEMVKIRHPYDQGLPARRGIEY